MNTTFNKQDMLSFGNYCAEHANVNGRLEIFSGDLENWKLFQNPNFNALTRSLKNEREKLNQLEEIQIGPHSEANKGMCDKRIPELKYAINILEQALQEFSS